MKKNQGFTLLIAIITTSMLLIVSFVVVNIALKQLVLANAGRESQYSFYAADSGTECAVYWDLKDSTISKFDETTAGTIVCNGQTISTGSQTVPTIPSQSSVVGGSTASIFKVDFTKGCAIVRVTKSGDITTIDSRGYNTCDTSAPRRFERGVTLTYSSNPDVVIPLVGGTGGTITTDGLYTVHTFRYPGGTFNPGPNVEYVEYLVVAGGGGGGGNIYGYAAPGSGGAGGARTDTGFPVANQAYPIVVGAGGAGGNPGAAGSNGGGSSFSTISTTGGGGGGSWSASGKNGGSGGGGGGGTAGTGISGEGYAGGQFAAAGGGAGGGAGGAASGAYGHIPGDGIMFYGVGYAGGGGGAVNSYGRGRYGGTVWGPCPTIGCGVDGTGGGGGAGYVDPISVAGGDGGDGIVIIRYLTP